MVKKWDVAPISEIAKKVSRPESVNASETYRLLGAHWYAKGLYVKDEKPGAEIRAGKLFAVKPGDFVYNRLFAWKGSFAMAEQDHEGCYVSNEFPCFELDYERIVPKFLWLYFSRESAWLEALGLSSGSTPTSRNRLKEEQFLQMQIPLPPLDEQRRIVARIGELAALIEEAQDLRALARNEARAFASVALASIFREQMDEGGWELKPLKEAAAIARGRFAHRPRNAPQFYGGNIPFIQIGDISSSNRYIRQYSQTLNQAGLDISRMFPKGTVVIAITGATIGATGILTFDCCFPDSIVGIIARQNLALPRFVYWALEYVKKQALAEATQTTQPNINLRILNKLEIPIPSLSEQRRLVDYLEDLQAQGDELTALQDATQAELDALLPSVLDQAFRGEL